MCVTLYEAGALFDSRCMVPPMDWIVSPGLTDYANAVATMEARAEAIAGANATEAIWLVEHPPIYTAGTSARAGDLRDARFPVYATGRGGQYTYHGPGQRVVYVMLDLRARGPDIRAFVQNLESWIVDTLATFGVESGARTGRVGVWTSRPDKPPSPAGALAEDKIAAIGIRLRRWVSFHGLSINVAPDLSHFAGIVPCGIADAHLGVTSLHDLGHAVAIADVDAALKESFLRRF